MMPTRALAALVLTAALASCATGTRPDPQASGTPTPTVTPTTPIPTAPLPTSLPPATLTPSATPLPTDLADGKHYAYLKSFDRTQRTFIVDVVQFLTGKEAEKAAQEDGKEAFDYYVRNQNTRLRTLSYVPAMKVVTNTLTGSESGSTSKDVPITHDKLESFFAKNRAQRALFWFELKGGAIVRLQEQYLP